MRLIHCADLHLDSKMNANLDKEKEKERRNEILNTFVRMVDYANEQFVDAILIAGDLFDAKVISAAARKMVLHTMMEYSQITFYYLKGNHDKDNFLAGMDTIPGNLKLFDSRWKYYEEANGKIVISGIELNQENAGSAYNSLMLDSNKFNIVMLHGQEVEGSSEDNTVTINFRALRNKGIDYLALGHDHFFKKETLDARGIYCYPGCLEGRGFDEYGTHGFVELDIDEESGVFTQRFIPFAKRKLYIEEVDVTGCQTTQEMITKVSDRIHDDGCEKESFIEIELEGVLDVECEKDLAYIQSSFQEQFYYVKVFDQTTLKVRVDDYLLDKSLKGEYVRQILNDESLSDNDKKIIIRYGLQVLNGEEVQ